MRPSSRWIALVACAVVLGAPWRPRARAQPSVRVRAESRIELRTSRGASEVRVEGVLRDDLGEPLPDRPVRVRVQRRDGGPLIADQTVRTDAQGVFRVPLGLEMGEYDLRAAYDGGPEHDAATVRRHLDLSRSDVRLEVDIEGGNRLDLDDDSHVVDVHAVSPAEGGGGLTVELTNELGRSLATGTTDAEGNRRFDIPSERLGPPGAGRIKARSAPDARRAEAQTEVPVVRFRPTTLTLEASADEGRPGETVVLRGRLTDSGGPLDGRAVGLFALGQNEPEHLATRLTDSAGRFRHELTLDDGHGERVRLRARFDSDDLGHASSASPPHAVQVRSGEPGWSWLLAPIALCALALAWLARRSPRPAERTSTVPPRRPVGVEAAARATRRPDRYDIRGRVLDHRDDEPVSGAMVTLVAADGTAVAVPGDGSGGFAQPRVDAGRWTLRIEAEGYVPAETTLEVPHRGEWSSARVRLESLRARALAPFRRLALTLLPSPSLWNVRTNREIAGEAQPAGRADPRLDGLARQVEQACYGPRPPARAEVEAIEREADALLDELRPQQRR